MGSAGRDQLVDRYRRSVPPPKPPPPRSRTLPVVSGIRELWDWLRDVIGRRS
jgi:hypothetical protein